MTSYVYQEGDRWFKRTSVAGLHRARTVSDYFLVTQCQFDRMLRFRSQIVGTYKASNSKFTFISNKRTFLAWSRMTREMYRPGETWNEVYPTHLQIDKGF